MKKKLAVLSMILTLTLLFTGCALQTTGNSLSAFCQRLNEIYETDTFNEVGYILDQKDRTLTQFYKFNENEVMLQFIYNEENELKQMNIATGSEDLNNEDCFTFTKNCISAYINDPKTEEALLTETDFENAVKLPDINTREAKIGDTELMFDVTEIGTVITVVQNNL